MNADQRVKTILGSLIVENHSLMDQVEDLKKQLEEAKAEKTKK